MRVNVPRASRLVWRDAYFPFWRAWVNGTEVPVEQTPAGMKAVLIPAGASEVTFRFVPTVLRATVAVAYAALGAVFGMWLLALRRRGSAPGAW